jgi:hypothetical protein
MSSCLHVCVPPLFVHLRVQLFFSVGTKHFQLILLFWLVISLLIAPWPIISSNLHNFTSIYTQWKRKEEAVGESRGQERTILCCFIPRRTESCNHIEVEFSLSKIALQKRNFFPVKRFHLIQARNMWKTFSLLSQLFVIAAFKCRGWKRSSGVFYVRNVYLWLWCGVIHMPFRLLRIKFMVKPLI